MSTVTETGKTQDRSRDVAQRFDREKDLARDLRDYLKEYARDKPDVVALWCFGIGFVVGWKLKPW